MKMAGKAAPDGYSCQGYFSDAKFAKNHPDAWVCASVESAANDGIISRANTKFRPKASITRIEALAIIMKASGYITPHTTTGFNSSPIKTLYDAKTPQWQIDVVESAQAQGIIDVYMKNLPEQTFAPTKIATRAEVFGFAYHTLLKLKSTNSGKSVMKKNSDSSQTYISASGDFHFTFPA